MAPISELLQQSESSRLDFKQANYGFPSGTAIQKSELLKDILAMANAERDSDGYIVIGVAESNGRVRELTDVPPSMSDNDVQEFVNSKTNRRVQFSVEHFVYKKNRLTVIAIARDQPRPLFLNEDYGRLRHNIVYVRQGSSTSIASPDEIVRLTEKRSSETGEKADVAIRLQVAVETWQHETFGRFQDPEPFDVEFLEVIVENAGETLLQYIQGSISAPRGILIDRIEITEVHSTHSQIAATSIIKLPFNNKLSEQSPYQFGLPKPPAWRPLSPGMELCVLQEKVIPIGSEIRNIPADISWEVAADNCRLKRGSVPLSALGIIDRRANTK